jgi:stage III sporulation protein AG
MMNVPQNFTKAFRSWWNPQSNIAKAVSLRSVLLGALGIGLLMIGTFMSPTKSQKENVPSPPQQVQDVVTNNRSYEEMLEGKLANKLSQIQGVGTVMVTITLESGPQQEYAKNTVRESRLTQEKDNTGGTRVTTETKENDQILTSREAGADRPVIAREIKPQIKGVLIVAEGAADSQIKAQLMRAVESALGTPSYRITVLPQKR